MHTIIRESITAITVSKFMKKNKITSVLAETAISSFASEDTSLSPSTTRSLAGIHAVKRALVSLCRSLQPDVIFKESDFSIIHNNNGTPLIDRFKVFSINGKSYTKNMFSISISHTTTTAFGLAAVKEFCN